MSKDHSQRRHSKYSASGAERWFNCSASVVASEGIPSKDNIYSLEGTKGHEVLEVMVKHLEKDKTSFPAFDGTVPREMIQFAFETAKFILDVKRGLVDAELLIESRVFLDFIHPEAFGSLDYAIVDEFGTLHIMDYKYGKSLVSPKENLQFIFYALAVAHKYQWNFKRVRMWTLQPRIRNFDGFVFWEISIHELKQYVKVFKDAIDRVENEPDKYTEGPWCHYCAAKGVCPLKQDAKLEKAKAAFSRPL